jgi:putative heme-binding domain-containing protein
METIGDLASTQDEVRCAMWFYARQLANSDLEDSMDVRDSVAKASAKVLVKHGDDRQLWMAAAAANRNDLGRLLEQYRLAMVVSTDAFLGAESRDAVVRLAGRAATQSNESSNQGWLALCEEGLRVPANVQVRRLYFALLEGLFGGAKLAVAAESEIEKIILRAAKQDSDPVNQQAAARMLASINSEAAKKLSLDLLDSQDVSLSKMAIRVCSTHNTLEFSDWLLDHFGSALPELRSEMFQAIRSNANRMQNFLERLEAGTFSIRLLDASQVQSLRTISDPSLATRIARVLESSMQTNRQKVVEEYADSLREIRADESGSRGKTVFGKNCAACHRVNSVGTAIGPDISDSRDQTFEKLLISVLDPNRSIDASYFRYMARTDDGKVIEGLLKDANSQTLTLYGQNGSTVLERSEVEEFKSSGASLMPDGMEAQISPQDMADLLWYIKNWRYAEEKIPVQAKAGF